MKIASKIALVLMVPLLLTWVVVLYAVKTSGNIITEIIEKTAVSQAFSVMEEIERVIQMRAEIWIAYGNSQEVQEALRTSNKQLEQQSDRRGYIDTIDSAWRRGALSDSMTLQMKHMLENDISDALRIKLRILKGASGSAVFGEVFITNRYGTNIALTNRTSDYRQDDEDWWQRAKQDGLYIDEVRFDESAQIYSTDICVRIDDKNGNFAGVLKAVMNIKEVVDIIGAQHNDETQHSTHYHYHYILFNSINQIIYSTDPLKRFLTDGSIYFDGIVPSGHGPIFSVYLDGAEKKGMRRHFFIYAFSSDVARSKGLSWCLVIDNDTKTILRPAHELHSKVLLTALFATLAALVLGGIIALSISFRLRHLSNATIALGQGNYDSVVKLSGNDELTGLASCFNDMTFRLKDAIGKIRQQAMSLEKKNIMLERNVTERQYAERQLREERDFAETLIETAQVIVLVLDIQGRIVRYNQYMEMLSGYRLEEVCGQDWLTTFVLECDRKTIQEHFNQTVVANVVNTRSTTNLIVAKDGRRYEIEWKISTFRKGDGTIIGVLAIGQDITEKALLQSQLTHAQKLEAIGQLAAGMAHEINTPIQFVGDNIIFLKDVVNGFQSIHVKYGELLAAINDRAAISVLVAEVKTLVDEIDFEYLMEEAPVTIEQSLDGIARITTIVRSMKEFSHPGGTNKELIDLNKAIQTTIVVSRNEWKYVADVVTDLSPSLPEVPVLIGDFNQVILNMIVNAAHAIQEAKGNNKSDRKGTITLKTTQKNNNWVEICISDTGVGMPKAVSDRIFDPFFTTKDVGKGTGQGLSIAYAVIVKKHGGTIDTITKVGHGTTFVIRLPITS